MEVLLLGPLEVRDQGRALNVPGNRPRELLALLALNAGRVVSAERLIELLWGDEVPPTAANALQVHISALRKVLEPSGPPFRWLISDRSSYVLRIKPEQIDCARFEQLVDRGHQALKRGDVAQSVELLAKAIGQWRGSALADVTGQPWSIGEAKRLEDLRLAAEEDRIEAELALGRNSELIPQLEALISRHPFRERLRGQLMIALYRAGRQAEASDVYQKTREVLVEELGMEPGIELQQLLKAIVNQDPALGVPSSYRVALRLDNLPTSLTSFVGRDREIAAIKSLLAEARLTTVVGPAGVGKTRLVLQAAPQLVHEYQHGVWLVELAPISDPKLVAQGVAMALGLRERPGQPLTDALTSYLEDKHLLLVLDNCEHLLEPAAHLTRSILQRSSHVHVLATSRERLNITGEYILRLDPLSTPDAGGAPSVAELCKVEAVQLFADRAAMVQPTFAVNERNAAAIVQMCRRLDGIPLAIELAAARLNALSIDDLLTRFEDRFLLIGQTRTAPAHHRTLRATLDWSYDLLEQKEKILFRRLGVFTGPWRLESAEAICGVDPLAHESILSLLCSLVDKSLVAAHLSVGQYWLLETLRDYARQQAVESGDFEPLRERHTAYFLSLAETARPLLRSLERPTWLARLTEEEENLRAALASCAAFGEIRTGLRLASALGPYWESRGLYIEGRRWLDVFLDHFSEGDALRAHALYWGGWLAFRQSDTEAAQKRAEESVAISHEIGDVAIEALGLQLLGCIAALLKQWSAAATWLSKSEQLHASLTNVRGLAVAVGWQGLALFMKGDFARAELEAERALAFAREAGMLEIGSTGDIVKTYGHIERAEFEQARVRLEEGLRRPQQEVMYTICALQGLAGIAAGQGRIGRAIRLEAAADSMREKHALHTGPARSPLDQSFARWMRPARQAAPVAEETMRTLGRSMKEDDAIEYALSDQD
jgi:predicted ATPase/DNA-binding SARP family transcriptional activator